MPKGGANVSNGRVAISRGSRDYMAHDAWGPRDYVAHGAWGPRDYVAHDAWDPRFGVPKLVATDRVPHRWQVVW